MSILRNPSRERFTVIDNVVFSGGLSMESIGLLSYLLSKPDHWVINKTHLKGVFGCGDSKIERVLRELRESGHLEVRTIIDENGKFGGSEYVIVEAPHGDPDFPGLPETGGVQKPGASKKSPPLVNTESFSNKGRYWGPCPEGVSPDAWTLWTEYKGGVPEVATVTEITNFLSARSFDEQLLTVKESIRNTWKGLFPLKERKHENTRSSGSKFDDIRGELWREIHGNQ